MNLGRQLLISGMLFCIFGTVVAEGGDVVTVGRTWSVAEQVSADAVDHAQWDALLKKYVDQRGGVDYATWKATGGDVRVLDSYLAQLSKANPRTTATRASQLAYWINAYNAVTVKGILREYPTTSIKNHVPKLWGYNIWEDLQLITPAGQYSLDAIEHSILRKMNEPRVHFAIVCASKGCPRLLREAYVSDRLDEQLTRNSKDFFADPLRFRFDARDNTLNVSPILKWFAEDFGSTQPQQMGAVAPYLPDAASQKAATGGQARVQYLGYDWSINEQVRRTAGRP